MTTVLAGGVPAAPSAFDTADATLRWRDKPTPPEIAAVVAIAVSLFFLVYFLPLILAMARRRRRWWLAGAVDLLFGWTVIGWIIALMLALTLPPAERPRLAAPPLSPDGRWWWDGQAWQPMPPGSAERAGDRGAS